MEALLLNDHEEHAESHKSIVATRHAIHEISPKNEIFPIIIKPNDYKKHKLKTKSRIEARQKDGSPKDEEAKSSKTRRKKAHEKYRDTRNKDRGGNDE